MPPDLTPTSPATTPENQPAHAAPAPAAPAAIVGAPGDPASPIGAPSPAPAAPLTAPASNPIPTPSRIIIGDRTFNSQSDADAYIKVLEQRAMAPQFQAQAPQLQAPQADVDPSDILFEDPKTAIRMIKEQAKKEIFQQTTQQQNVQNMWNRFYSSNPDLSEHRDLVEMSVSRNWDSIKTLEEHQAMPWVATEVRNKLSKIRGTGGPSERLPSGPANVAGSSGATPTAPAAPAPKLSTFAEEVAALRKRKT